MNDRDELRSGAEASRREQRRDASQEVTRAEEQGEAAEADAPTAEEENPGMNTVQDAEPLFGVQDDASDK
jgi:hypothetical protein